jgi:putative transposase
MGTVHCILNRNGLVKKRKIRPRTDGLITKSGVRHTITPNELWCADYKGEFKVGDGRYCYPLTISDHYSRYLLGCEAMETIKFRATRSACEWIFKEYGLPEAIRTDNGPPFGHPSGLFGLSRLTVWWMRLGISIERIEPGHPEQNGRHERMHLTLKQSTTRPAATSILAQQEKFDVFREEYNQERPHESLNMQTPSTIYVQSGRSFPEILPEPEYPLHDMTRIVGTTGMVSMTRRSESFYLAQALAGETIGLREEDEDMWKISFMDYDLGVYDAKIRKFTPVDKLIVA